ncbi:MAG: adenylosuccinate synthase [Deltaproteobacteria bacterium]|nr:adenylosuccinate synthase [Deltaproteobacteria bacterium]
MPVAVVVGAQWGDEGKGKVVDLLTENADVVARWGGGANAGHTLVVDGQKYVTHLMPSGVLRRQVTCVVGEGMVIDPKILLEEIRAFKKHGLLADSSKLLISRRAHMTLPHHRILDGVREQGPAAVGSTKRGIGPTYESKAARTGLRIDDLYRPDRFRKRLEANLQLLGPVFADAKDQLPSVESVIKEYLAYGEELAPYVGDASYFLNKQIDAGKNVLLEGAQGVLLDIDHGTYPFVTSSSTTAGGACAALGIGPTKIKTVIGIVKAYATRVGMGPFPTELDDAVGAKIREAGAEFGSTTGRPRRCGWLDMPALRLAIRLSGIESLALTKLDVLSGMETVKVCVAYKLRGKLLEEMPCDPEDVDEVEPVYEEHPGWKQTKADGGLDGLPETAAKYLDRVSELAGIPLSLISVGPGRDETIVKGHPFE